MPATPTQKINVLFRDNTITCDGLPEIGVTCGRRISSTKEGQCDARLGDWVKHDDDEKHPTNELRWLCTACHKIKTTSDAKLAAKDKRLRGETKQGPKAKIASRGFGKQSRKIPSRPFPKRNAL